MTAHEPILTENERDRVLKLVQAAGDFALAHWPAGEEQRPFEVHEKADESPVTSVDIAVNEQIVSELGKIFPSYGLYSEELEPSQNLRTAKRAWVLDPIDGTWNFIRGKKEFGVLLGLVEEGVAVFGVAYFPAYEMFFWASSGEGAFCNDEKLAISTEKHLKPASVYVRHGGIENKQFIYPKEYGTAHGFYFLCTGKVDALTVRITQHKEWDYCPFLPIVQESGGLVTDENGNEVRISFERPRASYLVAANATLHPQIMTLLPGSL